MIRNFMDCTRMYMSNKKGQGMVEYILIIVLVALGLLIAIPGLTAAISTAFGEAAAAL
jgi:Flp pilus assembly pilin Flp